MKLHVFTLVLNGMPWLPAVFATLQAVKRVEWVWHVSHGAAQPVGCTSWCKPIPAQLSTDGTTEWLKWVRQHPRVKVYEREVWPGKLAMVNAGLGEVHGDDVVMEIDSDEMWTPQQLELVAHLLTGDPACRTMQFYCRYFVGPNLVLKGDGYGNRATEWLRAWRGYEGFRFTKHEPPETSLPATGMGREATRSLGLVFDHYAYATEAQVKFKEKYYGYKGALKSWSRLQEQQVFPVRAMDFMPWIKEPHIEIHQLH